MSFEDYPFSALSILGMMDTTVSIKKPKTSKPKRLIGSSPLLQTVVPFKTMKPNIKTSEDDDSGSVS